MTSIRHLIPAVSSRLARIQRRVARSRVGRLVGGRMVAAVSLCAALSVGGLSDAIGGVQFGFEKNPAAAPSGARPGAVAKRGDGSAWVSLFPFGSATADPSGSRRPPLFKKAWLPGDGEDPAAGAPPKRDVFHEEMASDVTRREFFRSAVPYGGLIHEKAAKYDVDPALVAAVMEQESDFDRNARSNVGARGLMQIMPSTGRLYGAHNLYDPEENVDVGVRYIRYLQGRFGGNVKKTLAAYNAGEGSVQRYGGIPPFRETQTYVRRVMHNYRRRTRELQRFVAHARGGDAEAGARPGR